jgi:hypothetical protein
MMMRCRSACVVMVVLQAEEQKAIEKVKVEEEVSLA